jgi:hypothetical protein
VIYDIAFDHIDRCYAVGPIAVPRHAYSTRDVHALACHVHHYARQYLAAPGIDVKIHLGDDLTGTGAIYADGRHVGGFTVTPRSEETQR